MRGIALAIMFYTWVRFPLPEECPQPLTAFDCAIKVALFVAAVVCIALGV